MCVVEIGKPRYDAARTVEAVAIFAEKPRLGVRVVIFSPTVLITCLPNIAKPKTIPTAPNKRTHEFSSEEVCIVPSEVTIETTAAIGPIAFATSLDP